MLFYFLVGIIIEWNREVERIVKSNLDFLNWIQEWDDELALVAQRHADQCIFAHDCSKCRKVSKYYFIKLFDAIPDIRTSNHTNVILNKILTLHIGRFNVGQNLHIYKQSIRSAATNWTRGITDWYNEVDLFDRKWVKPFK